MKWGIELGLNEVDLLSRIHGVVAEVMLSWVGGCLLESADAVCYLFVKPVMSVCMAVSWRASKPDLSYGG